MGKWNYKTLDDLKQALGELNLRIPFSDDLSVLGEPLVIGGKTVNNRIVYQPLECGDSDPDGGPSERTVARYKSFAEGGSGIIWVEAVAVLPEARSNPRQLYIHEGNISAFKRMVDDMRAACREANNRDVFIVIQLTHTGRYSSPEGTRAPVIVQRKPYIEERFRPDDSAIISDDALERFEEVMGNAAALAEKAGFDGAEVKCCHTYLLAELLSAYCRPGPYGGSFENRTRLFLNCVENARAKTGRDFTVTTRLNMYDGCPHPWGWGAAEDGTPDLTEPLRLVEILRKGGMDLLNLTSGSPFQFHMTCPKDNSPEEALLGVGRMLSLTGQIKAANPEMLIVSSAYSYLRQFSPLAAAGSVAGGYCDMAGFGRMTFAYPDVARDILSGRFDERRTCLCCNNCGYPCRVRGNSR